MDVQGDLHALLISSGITDAQQLATAALDDVLTVVYDGHEDTPAEILTELRAELNGRTVDSIALDSDLVVNADTLTKPC